MRNGICARGKDKSEIKSFNAKAQSPEVSGGKRKSEKAEKAGDREEQRLERRDAEALRKASSAEE